MLAWTAADLLKQAFPTPSWLVKGVIPGSGWVLIQALPKTGKTILCLQLADALSRGVPFLHAAIPAPKRVTFVAADAPKEEYQAQIAAINPAPLFDFIYAESPICLHHTSPEAIAVYGQIQKNQPEFLVFDALESLTTVDFNSHEGVQKMVRQFNYFADGHPYILIHHPHKPKGDPAIVEDMRHAAAGHHYLSAQPSVLMRLTADKVKGRLEILPRRGTAREWKVVRKVVTEEVAVWVTG